MLEWFSMFSIVRCAWPNGACVYTADTGFDNKLLLNLLGGVAVLIKAFAVHRPHSLFSLTRSCLIACETHAPALICVGACLQSSVAAKIDYKAHNGEEQRQHLEENTKSPRSKHPDRMGQNKNLQARRSSGSVPNALFTIQSNGVSVTHAKDPDLSRLIE